MFWTYGCIYDSERVNVVYKVTTQRMEITRKFYIQLHLTKYIFFLFWKESSVFKRDNFSEMLNINLKTIAE